MFYIYNTTVILRFRHDHHYIALSGLRKTMNLSYLNLFKVRKTLSHLALSCKPTLPSQTDVKILRILKKKMFQIRVLFAYLAHVYYFFF